jgi:hypothetical protein
MFTLTQDQAAANTAHAPPIGPGALRDHLDPAKGCFQCHINLDPMAAIFSANFTAPYSESDNRGVYSFAEGEMRMMGGSFYYQGASYGIRGGGPPATGAFLGQEITGIASLGRTIADSEEFHHCAAQKAMEQIYGRSPTIADAVAFDKVVQAFTQDNDYDKMVQNLVSMPGFLKGN